MSRPVHSDARAGRGAGGLSDEAFEASQLLVELLHVTYATRGIDGPAAGVATAGHDTADAPPTHAIRAAIHVYQHGVRTVGELATGLGISYGWASRVVTELEQAGLVSREPDPGDRRIVRVSLTPRAVDMVESAYRWRGDAVERALSILDEDGRQTVLAFLRRVTMELAAAARERRSSAG